MLYYHNKKWGKSLESLFKKEEFTNVEEMPKIQKLLDKGETVYTRHNPYASEIDEESRILWDTNKEKLDDLYYTLADEI